MGNLEKIYELTGIVIDRALERASELNIRDFVIASCSGKSVEIFLEKVRRMHEKECFKDISGLAGGTVPPGLNVVCVTHQVGFTDPNQDEMGKEMLTLTNSNSASSFMKL